MVYRHVERPFAWVLACALALLPVHAHAQPARNPVQSFTPGTPGEVRPWAQGISDREQTIALDLYLAGNKEFVESRFGQALARYREAIKHWDHPAIRFNMAVCLMNLNQLVEAKDNLEQSLVHGMAPLGANATPRP